MITLDVRAVTPLEVVPSPNKSSSINFNKVIIGNFCNYQKFQCKISPITEVA